MSQSDLNSKEPSTWDTSPGDGSLLLRSDWLIRHSYSLDQQEITEKTEMESGPNSLSAFRIRRTRRDLSLTLRQLFTGPVLRYLCFLLLKAQELASASCASA